MSKFIQVNKMFYKDGLYHVSDFDSLLNVAHIIEIFPRAIRIEHDRVFQNKHACGFILREYQEVVYFCGSFSDFKEKLKGSSDK